MNQAVISDSMFSFLSRELECLIGFNDDGIIDNTFWHEINSSMMQRVADWFSDNDYG